MIKQKTQNLLLITVITAVIIVSFWFLIGFDRLAVQAQSNSLIFQEQQKSGLRLGSQDVSTNTINSLGTIKVQELQVEEATSIQDIISKIEANSTELGTQSINAGYEYIPASAFRHDGASPASGYSFFPFEGFIQNTSSSQMCLAAPVYVPNGVTFTDVFIFFIDDSATSDLAIVLWRKNHISPGGNAEVVIAGTFSDIDDALVRYGYFDPFQVEPGTGTVSNNYSYSVTFCFDPNTNIEQLVYGFFVAYN